MNTARRNADTCQLSTQHERPGPESTNGTQIRLKATLLTVFHAEGGYLWHAEGKKTALISIETGEILRQNTQMYLSHRA